jgi:hypothetical protein
VNTSPGVQSDFNYVAPGGNGAGNWTTSLPVPSGTSYSAATMNGVPADASGNPNGTYMLIDADGTSVNSWKSSAINVTAGVTYFFSCWISDIHKNFTNPSQLNFAVNNVVINAGTIVQPSGTTHEWSQFYTTWTAPSTTTINISMKNLLGPGSGNDLALDNIAFSGSCQFVNQLGISQLPSNVTVCGGIAATLDSQIPTAGTTFSWTRNATPVAGATGPSLVTGAGAAAPGRYILCYTKNGCSRQDTVDVSVCLPVELMYFKGWKQDNTHMLTWATAVEKNNDYFIIERSENGTDFVSIGTVQGHGNSSIIQTYHFDVNQLLNGTNYYRLKQVDYNGEFSYSQTIAIDNKQVGIDIFPNPNHGSFTIRFTADGESYKLDITDVLGRMVYSLSGHTVPESIEVNDLAKGVYLVRFYHENKAVIKKMMVY